MLRLTAEVDRHEHSLVRVPRTKASISALAERLAERPVSARSTTSSMLARHIRSANVCNAAREW
jgi:hypothetical protein